MVERRTTLKKTWDMPILEELNISATANGQMANEEFDGPWVNLDGKWYRPGAGGASSAM